MQQQKRRTIFGRRQARPLSIKQEELFNQLYPKIKLEDPTSISNIAAPAILEIGFGGGENIAFQASKNPHNNYIGCEPFINGIISLLQTINEKNLKNIKIFQDDASLLLEQTPDNFFEETFILFPDPWPKKRHHKRRFINLENLLLLHKKIKPGGLLHIGTDHADYLAWILEATSNLEFLKNFTILHDSEMTRPPFDFIPQTRFETKGIAKNHKISFLKFQIK